MVYTIRGLLSLTVLAATGFLVALLAGTAPAIGWALFWLPIVAAVFVHRSAPARFHRNVVLMTPVTAVCWVVVATCYLLGSWRLASSDTHELFVQGFAAVPAAFMWGCMYGLCITIGYCFFLVRRYQLSSDIRPLNGNDLLTRH